MNLYEQAQIVSGVCRLGSVGLLARECMHAQLCSLFLRAVVCKLQTGCLEVVNKGFRGRKQGGNVC